MTEEQLEKGIELKKKIKTIDSIICCDEKAYYLCLEKYKEPSLYLERILPDMKHYIFECLKLKKQELEKELENL